MTVTLTPSQFTSPDIRPTGTVALTAHAAPTDQPVPALPYGELDLDMDAVAIELHDALQHIEDLYQQSLRRGTSGGVRPVPTPTGPVTNGDMGDGNANRNPNPNFGNHAPIPRPGTP
ncbi:hypothetical protein ACWCPT_30025 [Streptomyces sp. NPDC002308]